MRLSRHQRWAALPVKIPADAELGDRADQTRVLVRIVVADFVPREADFTAEAESPLQEVLAAHHAGEREVRVVRLHFDPARFNFRREPPDADARTDIDTAIVAVRNEKQDAGTEGQERLRGLSGIVVLAEAEETDARLEHHSVRKHDRHVKHRCQGNQGLVDEHRALNADPEPDAPARNLRAGARSQKARHTRSQRTDASVHGSSRIDGVMGTRVDREAGPTTGLSPGSAPWGTARVRLTRQMWPRH